MSSCSITSKLMLEIQECIDELKRHFSVEKTPINDDCTALHRLEEKTETILQLGLKEKPGVFGVKRTYWDYICACFSVSKRFHEGIKFVKSNSELKSSVGRGRALIRFCLVHKCLADTLQTCFIIEKTTRDFYFEQCLPLQPKLWSAFISFLYDLNEIHFVLNPQSTELDVSWPSFARKIFLPPGNQILPSATMSFSGINDFSSELTVDELYTGDVSTEGENSENMDNETKHLVAANSELEADVLYLQKKCKTLEQEICDAAHTEGALETVSKNAERCIAENNVVSNSKVMNNNCCCQENCVEKANECINHVDTGLNFECKSDDKCSCNLKTQYSEENSHKNVENFSTLEKSPNSSTDFPLVSHESVLTVSEFDSSSLNSIDCSDLILLKKIDCLLQNETTPFHPEISNTVQELVIEMKVLLDKLMGSMKSVTDPVVLAYSMRVQIIRQYLEKILLVECKKLEDCKIDKQNFEEYACCMKSSALKQDKLIHSLLEQFNSCVKENKSLHERLCFLKDKLQSFGLLKPQAENNAEFKSNSEIVNQISDVSKISENYISLDVQPSNNMPNDYLESLQIFKTSSAKLHTLSMQATNLQLLLDSSHKLNDNLISRVQDQELHMKGITKQLEEAHNLLAVMKKQHQKLQSAENIVKYDLQEKRRLFNKLKQQLEATRENCNLVRMKNSKSEAEWQDLRSEFVRRNKQTSEESGFIDDKGEESGFVDDKSEDNGFIIDKCITDESCVVGNNVCENDEPESVPHNEVSVSNSDIESKYELKTNRLQLLEEQCQILCTNLKNSSKKRKELDYRLESWCKAIENSHSEASKKNNLSEILSSDKEYKDSPDQAAGGKINIDFNSDVDSSLSSPEIGSFNSDSCSYIPHNSSTTSKGLSLSLQSLKTDELVSSKIFDLDSSKFPFEHEEHQSVDSDPLSKELYDNCSSKTIDNVQDSSYFGSIESLGGSEKCQMENSDSEEVLTQTKVNGLISSTENKSSDPFVKSDDLGKLIFELEEEKKLLQSRCQELEMKNAVILEKLHQKTQELQLTEAAKEQEVVALQFQLNSEVLKYERAIKEYNDNNDGLKEMKQKVSDQEQLILTLEEALAEIQVEREGEKEHQWEQLQDIQLALAAREEECISLSSNIQQLEEIKMSNMKDKEMLEGEILHLRNDIKELQKKIIKLLKEKDILWKTNDRLRYLHKIQIDDRWMDDHEVSECLGCRSQFSFLLRKHHCRQCGRIFCHSCSNNWLLTPSSRRQIRVCNECYMQHMEIKTDVRRDSNVQYFDDSEDEAVVDDISLNFNRSNSYSSEMHPSIADSMMSLPAMQVTNLKQRRHFTSAPELHFSRENQEVPKKRSLNDPPLPCHMEVVENDISGNLLIKANEEAILPILNEVNSTSIAWSLEPPCEAIPISLVYEDTTHCSQQTVLHQSSCETDGVIHLSLPGLYKFHFDNKSRSSSMLVRYSFKANILKEPEISI
ncbi:FYVE and coiled-coil domain-containing protein 1 [Araneus ventricosus]|uniref:FYVE and coiled-coil domain-containing protein 1 n=1 Tax=Araneus ventricosus TaxID=182803 RepID=A0A4Y2EUR5_ARAVE|nr:FYVE and coiled-coil domain-containing protein 1 [Araneus ventricosus]